MVSINAHLVSRVVLQQFAIAGAVAVHNKSTGLIRLKDTEYFARKRVPQELFGDLEQQWANGVEEAAKKAINSLSSTNVLLIDAHIKTIKKLMALHYVRAGIFLWIDNPRWTDGHRLNDMEMVVIGDSVAKAAHERAWVECVMKAAKEAIQVNIAKIETDVENYGIEIGEVVDESEFILGDLPTLISDNKGNYGPQNGVSFTNARIFAMLLTPKYIVALKKGPKDKKYIELSAKEVQNINNKILQQTISEYYSTSTYRP